MVNDVDKAVEVVESRWSFYARQLPKPDQALLELRVTQ